MLQLTFENGIYINQGVNELQEVLRLTITINIHGGGCYNNAGVVYVVATLAI